MLVECEKCGVKFNTFPSHIERGGGRFCSRACKDAARLRVTHGASYTKTYRTWRAMRQRCNNPKNPQFGAYGGRGIAVCESWGHFSTFLKDMGECPIGLSLDRYPDVNGNYEPGNCRWATPKEQSQNVRRNVLLTLNGETHCVSEWARRLGIPQATIYARVKRGLSDSECLS